MKFYSVPRKDVGHAVDWRRAPALAAMLAALAATPGWATAPAPVSGSFQGIGYVSSTATAPGSYPHALSADGSTIVGYGQDSSIYPEAFRWTSAGGMQTLGFLNPSVVGGPQSYAQGVNADGSVVVGYSSVLLVSQYNYQFEAFRWTAAGGMVGLGYLNSSLVQPYSTALGVNADGSVVVGASYYTTISYSNLNEAFRWTQAGGMAPLGFISTVYAYPTSIASGVSADGSIVVGSSSADAAGHTEAFRWTAAGGMVGLGYLNASLATPYSSASAISSDGSTVVGSSYYAAVYQSQAFMWTSAGGMVPLGVLSTTTAYPGSAADAVDANGAVIVGASTNNAGVSTGFRWTAATGMQSIPDLLAAAGVSTTGWTLHAAVGVSSNGQFILGSGTDPAGKGEAYLVRYVDATVASVAAPFGGLTTLTSLQDSVDRIERQRQRIMVQEHGFSPAVLGDNEGIAGSSEVGIYGSAGSAAGGGAVRVNHDKLTLLGGIGAMTENYGTTQMENALLLALKLRYVEPFGENLGMLGEVGGWLTQGGNYSFNRGYINGNGTATGSGAASGSQSYGFGRLGVVWTPTSDDEVSPSVELGYQNLSTDGYAEPAGAGNPFEASVPGATSTMGVAKARVQWTHGFTPKFDATIWAAYAQGFGYSDTLAPSVAGAGMLLPLNRQSPNWGEYGARATYRINDQLKIAAFLDGVGGPGGSARTHVGGALQFAF